MQDPHSSPGNSEVRGDATAPVRSTAPWTLWVLGLAILVALALVVFLAMRAPGTSAVSAPAVTSAASHSPQASNSAASPAALETATSLPVAPRVGALAPDFTFNDVYTGTEVTLSSLRGHHVWLQFWATWCAPCLEEMPDIQTVYDKYKDSGLVVLGLNQQDGTQKVKEFTEGRHLTWTFAVDWDSAVYHQYGIPGLPAHVFVDKYGVIRYLTYGGLTPNQMEEAIKNVMGG